MKIEYRSPTVHEYARLRDVCGRWGVEEKSVERALGGSLFSVVAIENNMVAGCGRVVGDGGLYFYIQDLIVHPDCRKRGVGKALMRELMSYINANAAPGAFIGLMAAGGLEKYYEAFGFRARDAAAPGMYQVIK